MEKLKLIGLAGAAGCGKDTVAQFLCDTHEFRQIALAEPIRKGIEVMFGIPYECLIDRALKEQPLDQLCGKSPRQAMQTLGTEWGRYHLCLDIWLKVAQREIDYQRKIAAANNLYLNGIVISDIRFEGEAKWLRDQGGIIWHIERPNNPYATFTRHLSEVPILPLQNEPVILNDDDIDQLHEQIEILMIDEELS